MTLAEIKHYFEDHNLCLQTDRVDFDSIEFTITRNPPRDANELKLSDIYIFPPRETDEYVKEIRLRGFMDRMINNFEELERKKNKMKNIVFDISRDGQVGKLVIKDNVYDVEVKEVSHDSTLYNEKTVIKAEVCSLNLVDCKRNFITRTYNPDRKDSINEGKVQIKDVIFNPPATIVFWSDDTKTVVKAENEVYDPEKGLAMAIAKRALGNQGNYFETFKKYVDPYKKKKEEIQEGLVNLIKRAKNGEIKHVTARLYRIWYKSEDGTETVYAKEYIKEGNAVRVAKMIFAGTHTEWLVAKEDPFKNGVWDKAFGSDS